MALDTVTYPDSRVAPFVSEHLIPLKLPLKDNADLAEDHLVNWTPTVIISDEEGADHYRVEGYLPPIDFVGRLALGLGRYWLDYNKYDRAIERFEEITERHKGTEIAAEALYWLGVARYKKSKDLGQLRSVWDRLVQEYPDSEWGRAANIPATA